MEAIHASLRTPSRVDHYALYRLVATSATACIYRGTNLLTGTPVAIKIPHLELEGDLLFYQRIQREQQIGLHLDHPAIVKFFPDAKRSRAYIVMEWVEGRPLRQILGECPNGLPHDRALSIAVSLCDALEYLHSQGVVHRDLKPENVMVDDAGNVKLIDFGIASLAGARRLTFGKLSQLMGTPDYISPEQVRGKRGDARSDIYAMGVVLYEMLTGATPFPGDNPFAIMNLRLIEAPVPPQQANPEIAPQLQEILYRALEREPSHRYAGAREFSWDLRHQDQVGIEDRPEMTAHAHLRETRLGSFLRHVRLAILPASLMAILLYAARHT